MHFRGLLSSEASFGLPAVALSGALAFSNYVKSGTNSQRERGGLEGQGFRKSGLSFRRSGSENLSLNKVGVRRGWEPEEFHHLAKAVWGRESGAAKLLC